MQAWLNKMNIQFDAKDTKAILLEKSKEIFIPKKNVLEELTDKYCDLSGKNIRLLRLPVGHCELNAIELIWALAKTYVAKNNTTFKLCDVKNLMEEGLSSVSCDNWKDAVAHTKKIEEAFCKLDFGDSPIVDEMIINIDSSSDDDSYSDTSESE